MTRIREYRRVQQAQRDGAQLFEHMARSGARPGSGEPGAQDADAARTRFQKAAALLESARFPGADGQRLSVHELPWYVLIGAPGSGETTSLLNSGLRFPILANEGDARIPGVGVTRDCGWWFTEEAVLLDTAGRYSTNEGAKRAEVAAWHDFLGLLKRFRPQQPLNGAIVTVSVTDLMLWSKKEQYYFAGHLRMRLAELYAGLEARFPIYLLITKMDLLAGFTEFFGDLDAEESAQVWGTTFEYGSDPAASAQRYAENFAVLERRLYGRMVDRLHEEHDLRRRAAIYRFPQQFHALGSLVSDFLTLAFAARVNDHPPMLRGVYFTSGTQEGNPIDRVMTTLARHFGLEREVLASPDTTAKSYFVTRLLREVIFPEAGLTVTDAAPGQGRQPIRLAAYAALAALGIAAAVALTASYLGNREFVATAQAKAAEAGRQIEGLGALRSGDEARLVGVLNSLRDLPGGFRDRNLGAQLAPGLGLYQGEKISAEAQRVYRDALQDALLPQLALTMETSMRAAPDAQTIEAYLSLYADKGPDQKLIEAAALRLWQLPDALRADLAGHLRASLEQTPFKIRHPRDEALIGEAQRGLR